MSNSSGFIFKRHVAFIFQPPSSPHVSCFGNSGPRHNDGSTHHLLFLVCLVFFSFSKEAAAADTVVRQLPEVTPAMTFFFESWAEQKAGWCSEEPALGGGGL